MANSTGSHSLVDMSTAKDARPDLVADPSSTLPTGTHPSFSSVMTFIQARGLATRAVTEQIKLADEWAQLERESGRRVPRSFMCELKAMRDSVG